MPTSISLALLSIAIGALVGAAGLGGFFMPPALTLLMDVSLHQGMATSLFTFIFTGIAGTLYFQRKGSIDWALVVPLCTGAALTAYAGAYVGHGLDTALLSLVLAAVILAAGVYTLTAGSRRRALCVPAGARAQWLTLAAVGAVTGFLSGLTGIGGSVLSVPLMVLCDFPVLTAIGVGQVLQIVNALSGSAANLRYGSVDFGLAAFIAAFEMLGVLLGAFIIHRIEMALVKRVVGGLCVLAGFTFLLRTL